MMDLRFVGKNIERTDAVAKVTGSLRFTGDTSMAGILHGKIARSPHAHARILRIDITAAKEIAGVREIIIADDLPQPVPIFGSVTPDQPILASERVRFHGEPIAVVLADDEETAEIAVQKIKAEYEILPHACTVEAALEEGAPIIHEQYNNNVHSTYQYHWGDVEKVRINCPLILENTYQFPMIHHSAIEPFCVIAYPEDGGVTIKSPVQHPFVLRRVIAAALNVNHAQIRVVPANIGGGFGGKGYAKYEPLAAYLAARTGRPVKLSFTMNDGFFTARRLSATVHITTGFDLSGRIMFQDVVADYLIGAYADAAPRVVAKAGYLGLCGPYRTPNARILARAIYSNTVPSTAARGFGMPQIMWAIESQLNEAYRRLNLDAIAIRMMNIPDKGEQLVPGDTPVDGNWKEGLQLAADMLEWKSVRQENYGRGIALGIKNPIPGAVSNAIVKLHGDNSVTVAVGTTEMGQGARTVMSQITAEALGIPIEKVTVVMGDTATVPFDLCTAASRSTVSMGNAITLACKDIINQLRAMAIELKIIEQGEEVNISGGLEKACGEVIAYPDLLKRYFGMNQGEVVGTGTYKGVRDPLNPLGGLSDFWEMIFTAAEVKVNRDTGKVTVTKLVNVSDVGKVINPLQAKAQEEGGSIMALGHTLMEQMIYGADGCLKNGSPLDYRIPTAMDVPSDMKSAFLENGEGPGPYGSKGLGESGAISPAPAIAEAIRDAVGVVIRDLPLTPEKVWNAIQKQPSRTESA